MREFCSWMESGTATRLHAKAQLTLDMQLCGDVWRGAEWEAAKLTGRKSPPLMGLTRPQTGTSTLD